MPWLQVNADGLTRARSFGRLFGIGEDAGVGVVLKLWAWALEMAPDGDFRGLVPDARAIAAGCGLDPDASARVVSELQMVGLVATAPELRVRGLDRYAPAWRKNRHLLGKPPLCALVVAASDEKAKPKTETETSLKALRAHEAVPEPERPVKPKKAPDPRRAPLLADLRAAFAQASGSEKSREDAAENSALVRLLSMGTNEEILGRYQRAVALGNKWPGCFTFAQLSQPGHWDALAMAPGPAKSQGDVFTGGGHRLRSSTPIEKKWGPGHNKNATLEWEGTFDGSGSPPETKKAGGQ